MKNLHAIGDKLLPTIAYGDAAGLPFEAQPPLEADSLNELRDTLTNPYIGQYPAGTWSDDTHLSIAVAKSLIEADGFDLDSQASWHIKALDFTEGQSGDPDIASPLVTANGKNGWGKGTTRAVRRLKAGVSPYESAEAGSAGNGVLMKLAPLAYWQVARGINESTSNNQVQQLSQMTHGMPEATVAALVHGRYLRDALRENYSHAELLASSAMSARDFESKISQSGSRLSQDLTGLLSTRNSSGIARQYILDATPKHGFYAPETLVMAYGSFYNEQRFPDSVFRAVELGGDSDSIGSIVGTIALFAGNYRPAHDMEKVHDLPRLQRISAELAASALQEVI